MSSKNPRKKILFVTRPLSPPWDEASKNFAYDLAQNVTEHDITILVDAINAEAPEHITQQKIYTQNHFSLTQKVRLVWYLYKNATDFDAIHLLFTPTKFNSFVLKKILSQTKARVVQTIATVRDDLYSAADLRRIFFGDVLVTYSQWAEQKLTKCGYKNVHQIYPGINLEKFVPSEKDGALMQKWHIAPEKKIVMYPGEYVRLGATDMIVDAFLELWQNPAHHDVLYLCACRIKNAQDEAKKQEIIQKLHTYDYRDRVVFTDTYADVNAIYNLADVAIFPVSDMRGKFDVPLAMIEPYACKKPVIASDLPLFKEFSDTTINVIIPKADAHALAQAIETLLNDAEQRTRLSDNAYTFAHNTFNITTTAQKYTALYNTL